MFIVLEEMQKLNMQKPVDESLKGPVKLVCYKLDAILSVVLQKKTLNLHSLKSKT